MISKSQISKILFIQKNVIKRDIFLSELFKKLDLYQNNRISKDQFNSWLDSWEATAELDCNLEASKKLKKAMKKVKSGNISMVNWKKFKESLELS